MQPSVSGLVPLWNDTSQIPEGLRHTKRWNRCLIYSQLASSVSWTTSFLLSGGSVHTVYRWLQTSWQLITSCSCLLVGNFKFWAYVLFEMFLSIFLSEQMGTGSNMRGQNTHRPTCKLECMVPSMWVTCPSILLANFPTEAAHSPAVLLGAVLFVFLVFAF